MKKLALALVCFASVAFFASCQPENPEPTIAVMSGENYVTGTVENPTIIDINDPDAFNLKYGFHVESNAQTKKELASLKLSVEEIYSEGTFTYDTTIDLTGKTSFDFSDFILDQEERNIIAEATIKAVVTDVNNQTNTATIAMKLDQTAVELVEEDFEWYRLGNTITGLDEYGLVWKGNYPKDTYAKLIPAENVKLFIFESEDWTETTTDIEKAALFDAAMETQHAVDEYWNVNVTQANMTYDDVIGTVMPDGTLHLIHVTNSHSVSGTQGTATTITGKAK